MGLGHNNQGIVMYKCVIVAGLLGGIAVGMEGPTNLLFTKKPLTTKQIQNAYLEFAHLRILQSKESEKYLSEILLGLSLNWSDKWGVVGLILARTLIEKGANPHYPYIEQEMLETKRRMMIVSYTQTPILMAKGKLLHYLKQFDIEVDEY